MKTRNILKYVVFIILLMSIMKLSMGQPHGANITYNVSETKDPAVAQYLNTSGGTFTTIILDGETQNLKWKAYAGNVSGTLVLDDASDYSIYQWSVTNFTGEVYTSRNDSISWADIQCAAEANIAAEETELNHTTDDADSINSTFSLSIHKDWYVGNILIDNSTCRSAFTWVNDAAQTPSESSPFQEILLYDTSSLVYSTSINDGTQGFNFNNYDFQMIVPDRGIGGYPAETYYFYMELQ